MREVMFMRGQCINVDGAGRVPLLKVAPLSQVGFGDRTSQINHAVVTLSAKTVLRRISNYTKTALNRTTSKTSNNNWTTSSSTFDNNDLTQVDDEGYDIKKNW